MEIKSATNTHSDITVSADSPAFQRKVRKRRILIFTISNILIVSLLVVIGILLFTPKSTHSGDDPSIDTGDLSSPMIGKPAPDFTLATLNTSGEQTSAIVSNRHIHLAALKGHPVIINFWASWCDPCAAEAPFLENAWQSTLQSKGVVLIGVDEGDTTSNGNSFLQQKNISYPNVSDTIDGSTSISFGATGQPETWFIDKNGIIRARFGGPLDEQSLLRELAKISVH